LVGLWETKDGHILKQKKPFPLHNTSDLSLKQLFFL
jgi:hypothetical protein